MQFQMTKRTIPTALTTTMIATVLLLAAARTNSRSVAKLSSLGEGVSLRLLVEGPPTMVSPTPTPSPTHQLAPVLDVPVQAGLNFGLRFSADGKFLATASSRNVRIYRTDSREEVSVLNLKREALSVTFSPDGKYIVTGTNVEMITDEPSGIWIWDAATRSKVRNVPLDAHVIDVQFSRSGRYLTAAGYRPFFGDPKDIGAWVWEWKSGSPVEVFHTTDQDLLHEVVVSADDKYVVVAGGFDTQIFDLATKKQIFRARSSRSATFSPDGKYMAMANDDSFTSVGNAASVWKIDERKLVAKLPVDGSVETVAFSPDGKYLATGSQDKTIRIWDWASGKQMLRIPQESDVLIVAFDPAGKFLASAIDGHVRLWAWPLF